MCSGCLESCDLIKDPWVKKRLFLSPSRASNVDWKQVSCEAGACAELLTLLWEPLAKLPRGWEAGPLLNFTQQASPQTVPDAWVPVRDVVAASQLSHKPQHARAIAKVVKVPSACSQEVFRPAHSSALIRVPLSIPHRALFSQQPLRAFQAAPGSYGNSV